MSTAVKDDGVSLDVVKKIKKIREKELEALAADHRPRSMPVESSLGEGLRFFLWGPQEVYAIRLRLEEIGHKSNSITVTDANRGHCIKAIQIGLYGERHIAFPGDDGFNQIGRLNNAELSRLASLALAFNEVFK